MPIKKILFGLLIIVFLLFLYSYKILDVPSGLTVDEASFGYNATLLSQTGRDERGILHPLFVLYVKGNDWRQPITQYYLTALFKAFGPSVFLLRFSSVLIAVVCTLGVYFLARSLMENIPAIVAMVTFCLAPLITIQAHMGLDNIMPVPFVIIWLISLRKYQAKRSLPWLCLSTISLGFLFYSYKGARAIAPVWIVITTGWLLVDVLKKKIGFRDVIVFLTAISPFFLIIPYLEKIYPGAMLGNSNPVFNDIYQLFLPYLSSFDPSYVFIRGDITDFHSTGRHGMLLLSTLPLILAGIYSAAKSKENFNKFILITLFFGPILFGTVGSVHRFSRLLALIPLYAVLAGLGWEWFWQNKHQWLKFTSLIIALLMVVNYFDFINYYWNKYPPTTFNLLGDMDYFQDVARFAKEVEKTGMDPVAHESASLSGGESMKFFQQIYFGKQVLTIPDDDAAEPGQLLLTQRKEVLGMDPVGVSNAGYFIQRSKEN